MTISLVKGEGALCEALPPPALLVAPLPSSLENTRLQILLAPLEGLGATTRQSKPYLAGGVPLVLAARPPTPRSRPRPFSSVRFAYRAQGAPHLIVLQSWSSCSSSPHAGLSSGGEPRSGRCAGVLALSSATKWSCADPSVRLQRWPRSCTISVIDLPRWLLRQSVSRLGKGCCSPPPPLADPSTDLVQALATTAYGSKSAQHSRRHLSTLYSHRRPPQWQWNGAGSSRIGSASSCRPDGRTRRAR